jgi:AraC-like DNA-binding protein
MVASSANPGALAKRDKRAPLVRSAALYLAHCYRTRTAARTDEFAAFLGVSRPYLSRFIQERLGISPHDFLREQQLVYARRLLVTTPLSVDEIARASAFGTPWTFYRCFKAAYGTTPAQYRRDVTK